MNDTQWVKMTKSVGDNNAGEQYEIDTKTADAWISGGLCEKVSNPTDEALKRFEAKMDARDEALVTRLSETVGKAVNARIPAVPRGKDETKSFNEYAGLVAKSGHRSDRIRAKAYEQIEKKYGSKFVEDDAETKAMSEGTTTAGGFLVPIDYANELLAVPGYDGVCYDRVRKVPVSGASSLYFPVLDQTVSPSGGSSAFYGGVVISVENENTAPSETQPAFKQLQLTPKSFIAYTQLSQELIDNSIVSVGPLITDLFRGAIVADFDYNVLQGTGSGNTPFTGLVDNGATISVPRKTNNQISYQDVANLKSRLAPPKMKKNVAWVYNSVIESNLLQMTDNSGRSVWFVGQNAANDPIDTLLGYPAIPTEALPALGSDADLMLIDFSYYIAAVNQEITLSASPHFAFTSNAVIYRITYRANGAPMLTAPIKLMNGTDTVSPFVQLKGATS